MRKIVSTILAGAFLAAVPAYAAPDKAQAELAEMLEGRVAGEAVRCIDPSRVQGTTIIDGVGIIYRMPGNKLYLNRPRGGAESLDDWDVLLTELRGSNLCEREVVKLIDPSTQMLSGMVFLGEFVPYEKVEQASN